MVTVGSDPDIEALDLSFVEMRLRRKLAWEHGRVVPAIEQYRRFLQSIRDTPNESHRPLSRDMDAVWHEHILHTKRYAEDCQALFGRFVHHTPKAVRDDDLGGLETCCDEDFHEECCG